MKSPLLSCRLDAWLKEHLWILHSSHYSELLAPPALDVILTLAFKVMAESKAYAFMVICHSEPLALAYHYHSVTHFPFTIIFNVGQT